MSELTLHNLDERLLQRLQESAAARGVTVEEEAKDILNDQCSISINKKKAMAKAREIRKQTAGRSHTNSISLKHEIYENG